MTVAIDKPWEKAADRIAEHFILYRLQNGKRPKVIYAPPALLRALATNPYFDPPVAGEPFKFLGVVLQASTIPSSNTVYSPLQCP